MCVCVCVCVCDWFLFARTPSSSSSSARRARLPASPHPTRAHETPHLSQLLPRFQSSCCCVWCLGAEPQSFALARLAHKTTRARAPFFFFARWRTPMAARRGATLASRGLSRHASHDLVPCHGMLIAALRGKGGIALAKHALKPASSSGGEAARTRRPHSSNRHLNVVIAAARALLSVLELLGAGFLRMRLGRECFP